jgi:predicted Zn-dependent protease
MHPSAMAAFLATHPLEEDRVRRTRELTSQWPADALDRLTRDEDAFAAVRPAAP